MPRIVAVFDGKGFMVREAVYIPGQDVVIPRGYRLFHAVRVETSTEACPECLGQELGRFHLHLPPDSGAHLGAQNVSYGDAR